MNAHCPPQEQLEQLLDDRLEASEDCALAKHVESCAECQERLEQLSAGSLSSPGPARTNPEMTDALLMRLKKRGRRSDETVRFESKQTLANRPANRIASLPEVPGYEVLSEIGRGGMGVIYKARHLRLGRVVALKMILAGAHAQSEELRRFRIEASAVGRLAHPGIVGVYDVGEHEGLPYLSLELVEGGSLKQLLGGVPQPPRESARLVEQLARAVQHAHEAGIVHRDLKPANVLLVGQAASLSLGDAGQAGSLSYVPKITDFGLAKLLTDGPADGPTQSGAVVGTPGYMAPEQAAGNQRQVGPAVDVYALGAILYECLTGRPPFHAATTLDTLMQVMHDEPVSISSLQPRVPRDLATIAMRCLEKQPAKRYSSARDLADDLSRFLDGRAIHARRVGPFERVGRWCKRNPVVAGLLALVLLVLLGGIAVSTSFGLEAQKRAGETEKALDQAQTEEELARAAEAKATEEAAKAQAARNDADEKRKAAEEKEAEARKEADKARKARDFLVSIFRIKDIHAGNATTARQILTQAEQRIPIEFARQPELRDELLAAIADVNRALARTIPAAMILEARGAIQLHSRRGAGARPVPQTLLYPDDRLTLAADAQVQLVFLSDLHKERLQAGRVATIGRKGCAPADAVRERADDVLMTFVRLPKRTFYMGWNGAPGSAKKTEIKEDFEIAVHDVTQGQWEAVMGAGSNPSWVSRKGAGRGGVLDVSDEELKLFPVEQVSWHDAQAFIKKLNEKYRRGGYLYRLPSDAEWEYACRGGATSLEECSYHFYLGRPTNDLSSREANFHGAFPWGKAPKGPYLQRTTRVGAYPSNKLGLCDMHGNVWQWTDTAAGSDRVTRGGSWGNYSPICQASYRGNSAPTYRHSTLGFRLARVPVR
jgi:serine/threonine protein kinase/formylglycine-generating enzyme required for sulfatase activity